MIEQTRVSLEIKEPIDTANESFTLHFLMPNTLLFLGQQISVDNMFLMQRRKLLI